PRAGAPAACRRRSGTKPGCRRTSTRPCHPPDEPERPHEPLRPTTSPPRTETTPKPVGRVRPTPATPPMVRLENIVGRGAGVEVAPPPMRGAIPRGGAPRTGGGTPRRQP